MTASEIAPLRLYAVQGGGWRVWLKSGLKRFDLAFCDQLVRHTGNGRDELTTALGRFQTSGIQVKVTLLFVTAAVGRRNQSLVQRVGDDLGAFSGECYDGHASILPALSGLSLSIVENRGKLSQAGPIFQ